MPRPITAKSAQCSIASKVTQRLRKEIYALWYAMLDPRTPWYIKAILLSIPVYVLIPVEFLAGYPSKIHSLDDVIYMTLSGMLALFIMPKALLCEVRAKAQLRTEHSNGKFSATLLISLWFILLLVLADYLDKHWIYTH